MKYYSLALIPLLVVHFGACANEGSSGPSISPMVSGGNEVDEYVSSAADNGKCLDDGDFFVNSDPTKTCSWISKRTRRSGRFCAKTNVANKCRQTCRTCCTDVEDYTPTMSGSGKEKGCAWLGAQNRCDKIYDGFVVENKCPVSCGLCVSPDTPSPSTALTTIPTKAPTTKAPTNGVTTEPTVSPSTPPSSVGDNNKCSDDGDFFVNSDPTKTCSWISKKAGRSDKFCGKTNVANKCRQTCRTCCTDVEDYTPTMSGSGKKKGCVWLGAQNRCDKRYDGFLVGNKCPVSCGLCDPSDALTIETEGLHTNTTQTPTMPPPVGTNSTT